MAKLQDEVLKLLDESKEIGNQEQLDEASFEDIAKAASEIDAESLKNNIKVPASKFAEHCQSVAQAIEVGLKALKSADGIYKFNKNSVPKVKGGMMSQIKAKIGDMKDRSDSKQNVLYSLKSASRMIAQAQDDMAQAKLYYAKLNKELKKLARSMEYVQETIDAKTSFFGRNFGFWK